MRVTSGGTYIRTYMRTRTYIVCTVHAHTSACVVPKTQLYCIDYLLTKKGLGESRRVCSAIHFFDVT